MRRMPGRASTGMRRSSPTGGRRTYWRRDSGRPAGSAAHSCGSTARSLSSTGYAVQVASCACCRHHRPMRGVSIELLPDPPAAEVLSAICAADELGLHTAFLADEIYHRDAWLILAAAAQRTTRIRLAPGVAHVTLRDPLLAAQQLATLDELTGGRAAAAFSVGNLARPTRPCGRCWTRARRRWTGRFTATTGCSRMRAPCPTGCRCCWAPWAGR